MFIKLSALRTQKLIQLPATFLTGSIKCLDSILKEQTGIYCVGSESSVTQQVAAIPEQPKDDVKQHFSVLTATPSSVLRHHLNHLVLSDVISFEIQRLQHPLVPGGCRLSTAVRQSKDVKIIVTIMIMFWVLVSCRLVRGANFSQKRFVLIFRR